ncbi:sugar phosphate isomerase/epimerase family protein [Amycolatopsis sp. NPDC049252]|uniref:sugar phosphate isomerase/epimerase family protein n=1 Tax=Amycolatopsis sp. NPDC049252 TaxID=3363933 RepID=UPI00371746C0
MCGQEAEQYSRRTILNVATAALAVGAAVALPGTAGASQGRQRVPLDKISIQLYSLRSLLQNDPEGTLSALADIGYRKVELAGTYGRSATEFRAILDKVHLKASSTHVGIDGDLNQTIADAKILGNSSVVVPFAQFATIAEWEAFAGRMNSAAAAFKKARLKLGYHNHDHEFHPIDGVLPYDVLTAKTNKRDVHLEIDLFWAVNGGADPVELFRRNYPRVTQYHVKDRTADGQMTDPGTGVINFPRIFAASCHNIGEYIVEHDQPTDPLNTAKVGFEYLRTVRF